jgi:hypothetical protein
LQKEKRYRDRDGLLSQRSGWNSRREEKIEKVWCNRPAFVDIGVEMISTGDI